MQLRRLILYRQKQTSGSAQSGPDIFTKRVAQQNNFLYYSSNYAANIRTAGGFRMNRKQKKEHGGFSRIVYRCIRWSVHLLYPKITVDGAENLPADACIVVGNHAQMNGPICGELYFPGKRTIWCASQMMSLKEAPAYAYRDFWSGKPKRIRWFYKLLSYLIAPISVSIFNNARTIAVYRDSRLITTFKLTIEALRDNTNVIIFPECYEPRNHIVNSFQDKFIDIAKVYYKRTGKTLPFVPMYIAPKLKKLCLGKPVAFNPHKPIEEERRRICEYLMDEITGIAVNLPRHTVVPYANISAKNYPCNIPDEVTST